MLDPLHINLTRLIVELVVGPPILFVTIGMIYLSLQRRLHRRPSYTRRTQYPMHYPSKPTIVLFDETHRTHRTHKGA